MAQAASRQALEATALISIAQLSPFLNAPSTLSVKAIVTLTWPYSSAAGSVAFLLAEPDFRLRRTKGQIRAQFTGSSANAIAQHGIASGDEVTISLDGVEWLPKEVPTTVPGTGVEFELRFCERLLLEYRREGFERAKLIDIDHPASVRQEDEIVAGRTATLEPEPRPATTFSTQSGIDIAPDEFSTPAFLKRARTSYGSLFESNYDPFAEEDGTVHGKGRKRSRISSAWRYTSRSPSPEFEEVLTGNPLLPENTIHKSNTMIDEGVQTGVLDDTHEVQIIANSAKQIKKVGTSKNTTPVEFQSQFNGTQNDWAANIVPQPNQSLLQLPESHRSQILNTSLNPPSSPQSQLQPVPLSSSHLGAPRFASRAREFSEQDRNNEFTAEEGPIPPSLLMEDIRAVTDSESEDIYSASPAAPYVDSIKSADNIIPELDGLHRPVGSQQNTTQTRPYDSHVADNCYLNWQDTTSQTNHLASPYRQSDDFDHSQVEASQVEVQNNHGPPLLYNEPQHLYPDYDASKNSYQSHETHQESKNQYPDPEDGLEMHERSNLISWGTATNVAYPDLPNGQMTYTHSPLIPSTTLTRSHSDQSQVVDLVDSSDEDEYDESVNQKAIIGAQLGRVQKYEGSVEDYDEEESLGEDAARPGVPRIDHDFPRGHEDYNSDEVDEVYEEERYTQRGTTTPDEFSEDDEEGSYDEEDDEDDEDDEGERIHGGQNLGGSQRLIQDSIQKNPIVIDLLSSDEEGELPAHNHMDSASASEEAQISLEQDQSSEDGREGQSDTDMADKMVPYVERFELRTITGSGLLVESELPEINESTSDLEEVSEVGKEDEGPDPRARERQDRNSENEEERGAHVDHLSEPYFIGSETDPGKEGNDHNLTNYDETVAIEVATPVKVADAPKEQGIVAIKDQPSLFTIACNLDGANDALDEDSKLPEVIPLERTMDFSDSGPSLEIISKIENESAVQLPTPDVSQPLYQNMSLGGSLASKNAEIIDSDIDTQELQNHTLKQLASSQTTLGRVTETFQSIQEPNSITLSGPDKNVDSSSIIPFTVESAFDKSSKKTKEDVGEDPGVSANPQRDGDAAVKECGKERPDGPVYSSHGLERSDRKLRSDTDGLDSKEIAQPTTPVKAAKSLESNDASNELQSPMTIVNDLATPKGHDASFELALSSLESPSKSQHDLRKPRVTDFKLRLSRVLRTELSEFTALKVLRYHINKKLDVLAVVTTTPPEAQRAKSGPRHYLITFNITDPSVAPSGVTEVQVYRPYKDALPVVQAGDGILLRSFQVTSVKRGFALRSDQNEASSWVVFKNNDKGEARGPPVEYGATEMNHIEQLKTWYNSLDEVALAKITRANSDKSGVYGNARNNGKGV